MKNNIGKLENIIREAGRAVLKVYNTEFSIDKKEDKTPVTDADRESNSIILEGLKSIILPEYGGVIPVLSEESGIPDFSIRKTWNYFWLIDPLDGTKEFISKNGEFTINIALVKDSEPVFGMIYVPVNDILYYGILGEEAYKILKSGKKYITTCLNNSRKPVFANNCGNIELISNKEPDEIRVVTSRSHTGADCEKFINSLGKYGIPVKRVKCGSSYKFCVLAEGLADIYPRFGTTMEWDTAAGHAIVNSALRKVYKYGESGELLYNKEDLRNPWFIAV